MNSVPQHRGAVGPGTYLIRSAFSSTDLNLVRKTPGGPISLCIWGVLESPTQKWAIERNGRRPGFIIRNDAVNDTHVSVEKPIRKGNLVFGRQDCEPWKIVEAGPFYHIRLDSSEDLALSLRSKDKSNGTELTISPFNGETHQNWTLHKFEEGDDDDDRPPSYSQQSYIGPVPAGTYWIGQPDDLGGVSAAQKAPSSAGMTVVRRVIKDGETAPIYLSPVNDSPWPNQIWILEAGRRGYRFKNVGTKTYMNYTGRQPAMEPTSVGLSYICEWSLISAREKNRPAYFISPIANPDDVLGAKKGDRFNQLITKPLTEFVGDPSKVGVYTQWRFEPVGKNDMLDSNDSCVIM